MKSHEGYSFRVLNIEAIWVIGYITGFWYFGRTLV